MAYCGWLNGGPPYHSANHVGDGHSEAPFVLMGDCFRLLKWYWTKCPAPTEPKSSGQNDHLIVRLRTEANAPQNQVTTLVTWSNLCSTGVFCLNFKRIKWPDLKWIRPLYHGKGLRIWRVLRVSLCTCVQSWYMYIAKRWKFPNTIHFQGRWTFCPAPTEPKSSGQTLIRWSGRIQNESGYFGTLKFPSTPSCHRDNLVESVWSWSTWLAPL